MAKKAPVTPPVTPSPWIKSDEIHLDTAQTPWMDSAKAELGKKVNELAANDSFITEMRQALAFDAKMQTLERQNADLGKGSLLLGGESRSDPTRFRLSKQLTNPATKVLGEMEANRLKERNPEIVKYFHGLKTDPAYGKGKSYDTAPTYESGGHGRITAWCAAFVNWCLIQAGVPHLGYATARSWLDFGTPVAHPVYGCVTIIKPSTSTGSTTGHVAFFVEPRGSKVALLGGNQSDRVWVDAYSESRVLGYRWPTRINHYLLAGTGVLA
jgi:uncharacterized protein (TIGR02594 family)